MVMLKKMVTGKCPLGIKLWWSLIKTVSMAWLEWEERKGKIYPFWNFNYKVKEPAGDFQLFLLISYLEWMESVFF